MFNSSTGAASTSAGPTKQEIESVFSRLRAQPANKSCFDCGAKAPTWSSVTYGIFICIDCSAVHRNLGVHLTFVRSTNLDTNWTWLQLRQMQLGGNANAAQFFRAHNCTSTDAQIKYNSRAAQLYRDKLTNQANQAMKVHGTKLHLEHLVDKTENNESKLQEEEEDFFTLCENDNGKDLNSENNNTNLLGKFDLSPKPVTPTPLLPGEQLSNSGAPSVDLLNSIVSPSSGVAQSTIGVRKIQPKKTGLGARKVGGGGLGATKVKTNFADIEARANAANQCKEAPPQQSSNDNKPSLTEAEELESVASMRLAYQDLSMQQTRQEAKLKSIDPLKAKQMERLGMGFNLRGSDVSHSALSDMETIQQSAAPKVSSSQSQSKVTVFDNDNFFTDYTPNMYSGSSGGSNSNSNSGNTSNATSSKLDKQELDMLGFETIEPIGAQHSNITSMFDGADNDTKQSQKNKAKSLSSSGKSYSSRNSTNKQSSSSSSLNKNSNDPTNAQEKFGNSKGFGSDQFFASKQSSTDRARNLNRFQGSRAISSSDYFGDGNGTSNGGGSSGGGSSGTRGYSNATYMQAPDLQDVRDSVRQGVHKVAGRLSNLASDVMLTLQDKYGY